jgi:hypothetical protein
MADIRYIDKDFVNFKYTGSGDNDRTATLVFGDKVEVLEEGAGSTPSKIKALELFEGTTVGTVRGRPFRSGENGVLKFSMVDVQQGDGMIVETPPDADNKTKLILIDGGDNQLFARHVAARYVHRRSSPQNPLAVDLMIVTHGDADHFEGLRYIRLSENDPDIEQRKRLFIHPKRVYHNGLVKAPTAVPEPDRLGRTVADGDTPLLVELFDDPRSAPPARRNKHFKSWCADLDHWETRGPIEFRRIAHGMDTGALFDFLGDVGIEIHGPFTSKVTDPADGIEKDGLPLLRKPPKSALLHLGEETDGTEAFSSSHTINGHSIALRMTYGNVRFCFTGDLNQESMATLRDRIPDVDLECEILKAPHHGSSDFDLSALKAMKPVVSLISSGDESTDKEYIHPRATLVSALGKVSRGETGIVLCTELAAFFQKRDYSHTRADLAKFFADDAPITKKELRDLFAAKPHETGKPVSFFAFERTNFGIIHVRTDGKRVLVFTHSGKRGLREAYRFTVDANHNVSFAQDVVTG